MTDRLIEAAQTSAVFVYGVAVKTAAGDEVIVNPDDPRARGGVTVYTLASAPPAAATVPNWPTCNPVCEDPTVKGERHCAGICRPKIAAPAAATVEVPDEPYGYVWFNKHMEHRFTRLKPGDGLYADATNVTPVYRRTPDNKE